jgi:hypothetical protein
VPLSYTIDPDRRLVTITGDYANASEWLKLAAALLRDRRLKPGFCFIRDLRGATHPQNTKTVIAIFRVVQRFWPNFTPAKGAIVTDRNDDSSALVAQALADTSGLPIQVFTSYDAALEWLDDEHPL